jgi:hypothetical protein
MGHHHHDADDQTGDAAARRGRLNEEPDLDRVEGGALGQPMANPLTYRLAR